MSELLLINKGKVMERFPITDGVASVGRAKENQIRLNSPSVSPQHARITTTASGCAIEDLDSALGTFVNDQPITQHELTDQDIVSIGSYKFLYRAGTGDGPETDALSANGNSESHAQRARSDTEHQAVESDAGLTSSQLADRAWPASLLILDGPNQHRRVPLRRPRTVLGMNGHRTLALIVTDIGYRAMLLQAQSPVVLNGQALAQPTDLENGDTIVVDGVTMRFELGVGADG